MTRAERGTLVPEPEIVIPIPSETRQIIEVQKATWISTYSNKEGITAEDIISIGFELREEELAREIETQGKSRYWVVKNKGEIIGYGNAIKEPQRHEIKSLYILDQYQGCGLGKRLMDKMLSFLGTSEPVFVDVLEINPEAVRFYEKFGFKEYTRRVSDRFLKGSKVVEVVQMKIE